MVVRRGARKGRAEVGVLWLTLLSLWWGVPAVQAYVWKHVPFGAGGFVTGIVAHPTATNLIYIRTDSAGIWRWKELSGGDGEWVSLADAETFSPYWMQVRAIAIAPSDSRIVYALAGDTYNYDFNYQGDAGWGIGHRPGRVIKSTNRGLSWVPTGLSNYVYGNGDWRNTGEALAVDPFDKNTVYCGLQKAGLWRSHDAGATWTKITAVPEGDTSGDGCGITFVAMDRSWGTDGNGRCRVIYVGVSTSGIWRSTDAGATWSRVYDTGGGFSPMRAAVANNGTIYVTVSDSSDWDGEQRNGYVLKCTSPSGSFSAVTPPGPLGGGRDYCGVSVDPNNADFVVVTTFPGYGGDDARYWVSMDGGSTWPISKRWDAYYTWDSGYNDRINRDEGNRTWAYEDKGRPEWTAQLLIQPDKTNRCWVVEGYGVYRTDEIRNGQTPPNHPRWTARCNGLENLVTFSVVSLPGRPNPEQGKHVITICGDKVGARHNNGLGQFPSSTFNTQGGGMMGTSIDFCETQPRFVMRSGGDTWAGVDTYTKELFNAISTNWGTNWRMVSSFPPPVSGTAKGCGNVAYSATDPNRIVWAIGDSSGDARVYYTVNRTGSWNAASGAPTKLWADQWAHWRKALLSDRVNGNYFYIFGEHQWAGKIWLRFYRSTDGGATWTRTSSVGSDSEIVDTSSAWAYAPHVNAATAPGRFGHVWMSCSVHGVWKTTNAGTTFQKVPGFAIGEGVFFGKGRDSSTPAIYVLGVRTNGVRGLFMSENMGSNWNLIADGNDRVVKGGRTFFGDREIFGRVFAGTGGQGFLYGDIGIQYKRITVDPTPYSNHLDRVIKFDVVVQPMPGNAISHVVIDLTPLGGPKWAVMSNVSGKTLWRYQFPIDSWSIEPGVRELTTRAIDTNGADEFKTFSYPVVQTVSYRYKFVRQGNPTPQAPYMTPERAATSITDALKVASKSNIIMILDDATYPGIRFYCDQTTPNKHQIAPDYITITGSPSNRPTLGPCLLDDQWDADPNRPGTNYVTQFLTFANIRFNGGTEACFRRNNDGGQRNGLAFINCFFTNTGNNPLLNETGFPNMLIYNCTFSKSLGAGHSIRGYGEFSNIRIIGNRFFNPTGKIRISRASITTPSGASVFRGNLYAVNPNEPFEWAEGIWGLFDYNTMYRLSGTAVDNYNTASNNIAVSNNRGIADWPGGGSNPGFGPYNTVYGNNQNVGWGYNDGNIIPEDLNAHPLFVAPGLRDFRLRPNSSSLFSGKPNGVARAGRGAYPDSVRAGDPSPGAVTSYTLHLVPFGDVPGDARIRITFPNGFRMPASPTVTAAPWNGSFSATVNSWTQVTIMRSGGTTVPAFRPQKLVIHGVTNRPTTNSALSLIVSIENPTEPFPYSMVHWPRPTSCFAVTVPPVATIGVSKSVTNVTLGGVTITSRIPGASLHIKMVCSNTAGATARGVIVYDRIWTNTMYRTNSAVLPTGWDVQWSTNANPNHLLWDTPDYVSVSPPVGRIRWVRFRGSSLPVGQKAVLRYTVIVR